MTNETRCDMINPVKGLVQPLRAGRKVIMTTLNKLANINVTINFELPVECLTLDDFVAMSDDALRAIQSRVASKMNADTATEDEIDLYWGIEYYWDNKYYEDNIDAFNEYRSHMGEPDFDWDFYSDWHKDMYGFRPR